MFIYQVYCLVLPVPVAACMLRLWVRNPPGAWMCVCCVVR